MDGSSAPSLAWRWTLFKIWHQGVPQLSSQGPLILMQRLQWEAFLFPVSLPQDRRVAPFAPPPATPRPPGIEAIGHIIDPVDHLFRGIRLDWLMQPLSPVDCVEVKARDHSPGCSPEPGQQQAQLSLPSSLTPPLQNPTEWLPSVCWGSVWQEEAGLPGLRILWKILSLCHYVCCGW